MDGSSSTVSEIFIGLIAPVGADLDSVEEEIEAELKDFGYRTITVKLSKLLDDIKKMKYFKSVTHLKSGYGSEYERIKDYMKAGSGIRNETGQGDIMAMLAIAKIQKIREEEFRKVNNKSSIVLSKVAFIFKSLKHPDEVETLRLVYREAFLCISACSQKKKRIEALASKIASTENITNVDTCEPKARELINIDESEENNKLGQDVSGAFPLADVFVNCSSRSKLKSELKRFFKALFSNPYVSPSIDEFMMYMAYGAALRSADLARQVGAVISTDSGDVISVGSKIWWWTILGI